MTHNIHNTTMADVPASIVERVAHVANDRVRLALACCMMNRDAEAAYTGPRGSPVNDMASATNHEALNAAIAGFDDVMGDAGYDEPYYDPATDSYSHEFSVRNIDTDKRVRVRGDDPDELAKRIRAFTSRTRAKIKDANQEAIQVPVHDAAIVAAYEAGTLKAAVDKYTGVESEAAECTPFGIGLRYNPSRKHALERAIKRMGVDYTTAVMRAIGARTVEEDGALEEAIDNGDPDMIELHEGTS